MQGLKHMVHLYAKHFPAAEQFDPDIAAAGRLIPD